MSLLQKLAKDLSSLAELHSLRKQLRTLQSVYELTVSDRDKKIADLEKQLEATKYYTNQYQKAFYRGTDYNDQLVEENGSLKEQLQTAISNYDERDRHYTTLEAAHIKLGAELDKSEQEIAKLTREKETLEVEGTDFINVLRSKNEDIDNLKAEVQIAEDDFDEMANLYTNLHKAFDDLVDTNADLAKKLREATLHKTANEKLQRDVIDLQQYNAAVTAEVKKLQVASAEWDSMYKGYVTATNENSRLKAENESLAKNLVEVTKTPAEFTKHCNQLKTELQTANNEIIALKEQLQSFNTERGFRATEYKILSEQYDKLHKTNESINTKISKLELENAKYKAVNTVTLTEVMAKNEQLENRISALINDNAGLREEVIKTKFYNSQLEQETLHLSNENSRLKAENESLTKNLAANTTGDNMLVDLMANLRLTEVANKELNTKYSTLKNSYDSLQAEATQLEQETLHLKTELQTAKLDLTKKDKVISDAEIKYSHDQTQAMRAISRLQDELVEFKKYKDLAKYFSEDQSRLIDKVKAIQEVVKVLEPISMKFQTVLFNLLDDVNVPRT